MSTKDYCSSFIKDNKQEIFVGHSIINGQYNNLNLNQNNQCLSLEDTVGKKYVVTSESRKVGNYDGLYRYNSWPDIWIIPFQIKFERTAAVTKLSDLNENLQKSKSPLPWSNSKQNLSSPNSMTSKNFQKGFDLQEKDSNKSTLSLHISAYENSINSVLDSSNSGGNIGLIKKCKNTKELFVSGSAGKSLFEFPRQQDKDHITNPEVMQFKTSQKLSNPNQGLSSTDNNNGPQLQSGVTETDKNKMTTDNSMESTNSKPPTSNPVTSAASSVISSTSTSDGSILPSRSDASMSTTTTLTETPQIPSPNPSILTPLKDTSCKDCPTPVSSVSSIQPHHSVSNYDPSVSRLNLPKDVIANLEKLVSQPKKSVATNIDPDAPTPGMKIRFYTSLLVLASIGLLGLVANSYGSKGLAGIVAAGLTIFAFHWFWVYGSGLSRHKKTYFNEKNVLDTYKVYDRELGHLFQKEPDTPGNCCGPPPQPGDPNVPVNPVQNVANDLLAKFKAPPQEKAEFSAAVQDHYGNMYDNIKRINQEMDLMAKAKIANADAERLSTVGSTKLNGPLNDPLIPHAQSGPLVPADIPLPGQMNNNKKSSSSNNNTVTK